MCVFIYKFISTGIAVFSSCVDIAIAHCFINKSDTFFFGEMKRRKRVELKEFINNITWLNDVEKRKR